MVALAGVSVALVVLLMPSGLVEMGIASSGLSEAWPAAAPPLGMKARLLLSGFAALMTMGAIMMVRRERPVAAMGRDEERHDDHAGGARLMGFAFTKLSAFAKGRSVPPIEAAPAVRRADAHPDAPVRAPIFASRDFGGSDIFEGDRDAPFMAPRAPMAFEAAPEMREAEIITLPSFAAVDTPAWENDAEPVDEVPTFTASAFSAPVFEVPAEPAPTQGLSIGELTDRLERGLSLRNRTPAPAPAPSDARIIADMPVVPAMPVREMPSENADEALRTALSALRSMAARPR